MKYLACVVLACLVTGCGYSFIKKSELLPHRLAADSVHIASLESQLATLQARFVADSLRCDLLRKNPPVQTPTPDSIPNTAAADSVLRARDLEIQTLRDQLEKLTTEMERIKRRLANPRA